MSTDDNPSFIKENINKQPKGSKILKKILRIVLSAVLFGVVAVCAAVLSKPFAEKYLGKEEETTTTEIVTIARDERETTAPKPTLPAVIETTARETEPVEEIVRNVIDEYEYSIDDMNELWSKVSDICDNMDSAIVTVKTVKNGTDWFDNELDNEGAYSGIAIAKTDSEYLILAPKSVTEGTDSIRVKWSTGHEQRASVKGVDSVSGLAVIAVRITEMDELTAQVCNVVDMGNSYLITRGNMLIAVGSPLGSAHSTAYAWVSYIENGIKIVDGTVKLIFTNSNIEADKGSWILNNKGELIGWVTDSFSDRTAIASLSDFKAVIERMVNAGEYAYIGIKAADVSLEMEEEGMPVGMYVTEVENGGPAYEAGIQPGDIISRIGEQEIANVYTYESALESMIPGETVEVLAYRSGRDEYKEIVFDITPDKR